MSGFEHYLADAESLLRESDYPLPVAWALSFIVDYRTDILAALYAHGQKDLAASFSDLADEIQEAVPDEGTAGFTAEELDWGDEKYHRVKDDGGTYE